jgi:hypothetical protein
MQISFAVKSLLPLRRGELLRRKFTLSPWARNPPVAAAAPRLPKLKHAASRTPLQRTKESQVAGVRSLREKFYQRTYPDF